MFPLKMKPNRLFAIGAVFVLSLVSISVLLAVVASAQGDASRTGPWSAFEAARSPQQEAIVRVEPAVAVVEDGETFRIYLMIEDAVNLGAFEFIMDYDPAIVEVPDESKPVTLGPFLLSTGRQLQLENKQVDLTTGVITYGVSTRSADPYTPTPGPDGDGVLAFIDLSARNPGSADLDLRDVELTKASGYTQAVSTRDGLVIVGAGPDPRVSIDKDVNPSTVAPQEILTYTLECSFSYAGQHSYDEIVSDPVPSGTTYLAGSATLNGLPAPELYSSTLDAIYYRHNDVFTDTDQWTIAFQVQVGSTPSGTLIFNTVTEAVSFDGPTYVGPHSDTSTATVRCTLPAAPNLSTPVNGSSTCDTTPYFGWSSVSGATSYRIQVDDNSSFSSPEIDTTTSNPEYTPASALSPGTYYWHVQASDGCVGPWSSVWSFTILSALSAPSLSSPSNGSSTCDTTPHLSWSSVSGATSYRIQVDDNSSFSPPEIDTTTSNLEYTPASALSPGTYYWHVQASDGCVGPWSATWEFTIRHCIYLPLVMKNH